MLVSANSGEIKPYVILSIQAFYGKLYHSAEKVFEQEKTSPGLRLDLKPEVLMKNGRAESNKT